MAKSADIKNSKGNILFSTLISEGPKRKFTLQKEDYIILNFSVYDPVYFNLGDGIDDSSVAPYPYELVEIEKRKATYNETTGGYDYTLQLDAYYRKWKNKIFKYTPENGGQEASWNLTATLDVHLDIFLRNLTTLGYTFRGTAFQFSIDATVQSTAKLISYDSTNMIDALTKMAETWACEWWVTDNIIHFGRCEFGDPVDFEIDVNVKSMSRSDSQTNYATRIFAFGSTRNIPPKYRPVDEQMVVNGVVQRRLMLPVGTPYVDAYKNMTQEEAVEDIVVFDDVYPRRTGTMSDITTKEYTDTIENKDGTKTTVKWNAYRFKDTGITFSKDYIIAGEELKINIVSGLLNGMEFGITFNPDGNAEKLSDGSWNPEAQLWEIVRNDNYGRNLPDSVLIPKNGDTYILSGFDTSLVSDQYLPAAERELKEKTEAYVEKTKIDPSTYDNKMDSDYMYNNGNLRTFEVGDRVNLINEGYFKDGRVSRIIGFEYNLDKPYDSPTFTVGETAAYSRIGEIENKVDSVTYKGQNYTGTGGSGVYVIRLNDSTTASNSNVYSALRALAMFLRKDVPNQAAEIIDFLKGWTVGDNASIDKDGIATVQQLIALVKAQVAALEVTGNTKTNSLDVTETAKAKDVEVSNSVTTLNAVIQALAKTHDLAVENTADIMNGIIRQYLSSESFVSGFLGSGFKIWQDDNGLWHGELDELTVRKTFLVFELVVQKIVHQGGMIIRSAAGGKLKKVTDGGTYWKCEHDSTDDFVVGDQVLCQTFTGTSMKRYWRLVTSAGAGYFNLSKSDCETGSANPEAGDEVAVLGNRTVAARQKAQIDCAVGDYAPYRDDYSGISSYSLVGKLINRTGNLTGITDPDFGALSGSGLYGINVYLKGIFRLLSGKTVETAISDAQAESNAYTDGKITKIETSFEIREGQISSKVTEATTAAKNADNSAVLAQGYASTAGQKASAAAGSASEATNVLTTVTQKETSIQQTAQAIELKAVRAESAAGRAESAEASINLKADGIVLQASNQAAKSAVDGVQVGGRNLMLGSESFIINGGITIGINFIPGQQYTISIEKSVNVNPGNQSGGSMLLYCADVEPYPLRIYIPISGSKQVATFTYPTTGKGNLNLCATEAWTGLSDITKLKIEIGNKATDWTPAPEDVAQDATTKANTAESNAKSYANNTFTTKTTYEAGIQILSGQISSKVSQTDFDTLGLAVSSHTSTINQLPTTIDQRITSQVADGGIIKTNVESWFTLSGNTISLGAKSLDISGAVVFNSLATQSQAQGYAKTAVDGVQVGGRNLALNSDIYINNNEYNIRDYLLSQDLIAGEIYTATIWGSLYSSKSYFGMWMGGGYTGISGLSKIKDGVYQATFTMPNSVEGNGYKNVINIYTVPYNIVGISTIYKFKLEQGNKATDWTPAPEDVAQDATNKANTAEGNAKGYSDVLKNSLGSLAYANTVSLAKLDTTIIEGGYIKTALIDANTLITNSLLATKIAATDITTGRLAATDGAKIGGWIVEGNALKINSAAGAKILVEPSGTRFLRINDSADALMAVRADGVTGISIYTQDTTGKCLRMTAQTGGTAIESYGSCQFKARTGELISLLGATSLGGIAINATSYSSTSVTLTNEDSFVMCKASDSMSVYMPSSPTDGKVIIICCDAHISVRIYGNGKYVRRGISNYSYRDIDEDGQMVILIYNGGYWYINYLNS